MKTFFEIISLWQSETRFIAVIVGLTIIIAFVAIIFKWPLLRAKKKIRTPRYEISDEVIAKRSEIIKALGKKNHSRGIAIIHRDGQDDGIDSHIDENTAEDMLDVLRQIDGNERIDIILHTPGGYTSDTLRIAFALKAHKGPKTVYVPYLAMSGGTLIALAATEIVMADHAVLGPIDPIIWGIPAASVLALQQARKEEKQRVDDEMFLLADMASKAMKQVRSHACQLMHDQKVQPDACAITDRLVSGEWTHDYPITKSMAGELGLRISTKTVPEEMFELIALYPNPRKHEPSVKFGASGRRIEQSRLRLAR